MPPSLAKCGVLSGCQSWVYTTVAPAAAGVGEVVLYVDDDQGGLGVVLRHQRSLPALRPDDAGTKRTRKRAGRRGLGPAAGQASGVAGDELVVQALAGAPQQAGDLHLGAADQRADLALLLAVEVVQDY